MSGRNPLGEAACGVAGLVEVEATYRKPAAGLPINAQLPFICG
ncbi:hypothetical protein ABLE92_17230 [Gordonia sp. VNQ95]